METLVPDMEGQRHEGWRLEGFTYGKVCPSLYDVRREAKEPETLESSMISEYRNGTWNGSRLQFSSDFLILGELTHLPAIS